MVTTCMDLLIDLGVYLIGIHWFHAYEMGILCVYGELSVTTTSSATRLSTSL